MRALPSPWSIIKTDNVCWAILTSAPLVLFMGLMIKFTGTMPGRRGGPDVPLDPAVEATVRKVSYFRGARTQLVLEYKLEGDSYKIKSTFIRWSQTPVFSGDTRIPVLVDSVNPRRAVPLDLYAQRRPRD